MSSTHCLVNAVQGQAVQAMPAAVTALPLCCSKADAAACSASAALRQLTQASTACNRPQD